ncbi:TPA: hypothetical protein N0F65_002685, partial [Lagenidium giganteum]
HCHQHQPNHATMASSLSPKPSQVQLHLHDDERRPLLASVTNNGSSRRQTPQRSQSSSARALSFYGSFRNSTRSMNRSSRGLMRSVSNLFGAVEETFYCQICFENVAVSEAFKLTACGHPFCRACLEQYLDSKISDAQLYPVCFHEDVGFIAIAVVVGVVIGVALLVAFSPVIALWATWDEFIGMIVGFGEALYSCVVDTETWTCQVCETDTPIERHNHCTTGKCPKCATEFCWLCGKFFVDESSDGHVLWWNPDGCVAKSLQGEDESAFFHYFFTIIRWVLFVVCFIPGLLATGLMCPWNVCRTPFDHRLNEMFIWIMRKLTGFVFAIMLFACIVVFLALYVATLPFQGISIIYYVMKAIFFPELETEEQEEQEEEEAAENEGGDDSNDHHDGVITDHQEGSEHQPESEEISQPADSLRALPAFNPFEHATGQMLSCIFKYIQRPFLSSQHRKIHCRPAHQATTTMASSKPNHVELHVHDGERRPLLAKATSSGSSRRQIFQRFHSSSSTALSASGSFRDATRSLHQSSRGLMRSVSNLFGAMEETFYCQICFENVAVSEAFKLTACGHPFCRACLEHTAMTRTDESNGHIVAVASDTPQIDLEAPADSDPVALMEAAMAPMSPASALSSAYWSFASPRQTLLQSLASYVTAEDTFYCQICFEHASPSDAFTLSACGHLFCTACLAQYVTVKVNDAQVVPLCFHPSDVTGEDSGEEEHVCGRAISEADIGALVTPDVWDKYERFKLHKQTNKARDCPYCGHSQVFEHGMTEPQCVCEACAKTFCFEHSNAHEGRTCAQYEKATAKAEKLNRALISKISKPCPGCGHPVEKNGGCNHMKCIACQTDFCWLCCKIVDREGVSDHYDWWNIAGCPGLQMSDVNPAARHGARATRLARMVAVGLLGLPIYVIALLFALASWPRQPLLENFIRYSRSGLHWITNIGLVALVVLIFIIGITLGVALNGCASAQCPHCGAESCWLCGTILTDDIAAHKRHFQWWSVYGCCGKEPEVMRANRKRSLTLLVLEATYVIVSVLIAMVPALVFWALAWPWSSFRTNFKHRALDALNWCLRKIVYVVIAASVVPSPIRLRSRRTCQSATSSDDDKQTTGKWE